MVEHIQRGSETHYLSYISSPDGLVAMHISDDDGRDEMKYVLTDYLGTIYALVDDGAQSTEDALYYSFNAWGERRELQAYDGSLTAPLFSDPADYITSRGYTGHEHIDAFDLINMNGRAYDPVVGAFLSPDPYVQAPDMPQNLNRYAYCLNNPLKYTDPEGEFVVTAFLVGLAVSAIIDYGIQVATNYMMAEKMGYSASDIWFNKVDFFDVAVSGIVGGVTGGYGAVAKGAQIGKFGKFVLDNRKWIAAGEIMATSAIDITGEGWQPVGFDDFAQRTITAGATQMATKYLTDNINWGKSNKNTSTPESSNNVASEDIVSNNSAKTAPNSSSGAAEYNVYAGYDENGVLRYVGITKRDVEIRWDEHLKMAKDGKQFLDYSTLTKDRRLTKLGARIMEQNLINTYRLGKDGGQLLNRINSISPKYWAPLEIKLPDPN